MRRSSAFVATLGALLAVASAAALAQPDKGDIVVVPRCDGPEGALSNLSIDGKTVETRQGEDAVPAIAAALGKERDKGRKVRVIGNAELPYRCIGGVIFALQRAGVARVDFDTDPLPAAYGQH